jgi:hypothetical protein
MTYHTIMIGDPVWAPVGGGTYGWRAGTVEGIGKARYELTRIKLRFERTSPSARGGPGQVGYRPVKDLVKRNPTLKGKDKPATEARETVPS